MRFVTYQPLRILSDLEKNDKLNRIIWAIPLNENSYIKTKLTGTSMPQVMLVLETEDYKCLDYVKYIKDLQIEYLEVTKDDRYVEYHLFNVSKENVVYKEYLGNPMHGEDEMTHFLLHDLPYLRKLCPISYRSMRHPKSDALNDLQVITAMLVLQCEGISEDLIDLAYETFEVAFGNKDFKELEELLDNVLSKLNSPDQMMLKRAADFCRR